MATSSKRFIIILIMTYVLLGMIFFMVGNSTNTNPNTQMSGYIGGLSDTGKEGSNIFGDQNLDESQTILDRAFGNSMGYGRFIWTVLSGDITKGLMGYVDNSGEIQCPDCPDPTTAGILGGFLSLYFIIIHILAGLEIYYIIINKKND